MERDEKKMPSTHRVNPPLPSGSDPGLLSLLANVTLVIPMVTKTTAITLRVPTLPPSKSLPRMRLVTKKIF